ncbi:uncharacterized protein LOC132553300 [Ylistrum balloti]|uniref:uncharacterized protein LOC132553300 n=1 Tax=Ylistrum balloti TaxID=509963 RepID=UPI0029058203|nr:uncharacterized protein LOC132553300 [Ylistrum balloti]
MEAVKMSVLMGIVLLCTILTVQANDGTSPEPGSQPPPGDSGESGEEGRPPRPSGDDHFGYKDDGDDDDDDDCDDKDEKMKEKGRMGDDMHHKEDHRDKEEHNEHSKSKRCSRKKIAKILIIVGCGIAIIGTGVGLTICYMRHQRQKRRHVSDSKTNLHAPGDREKVYMVPSTPTTPQNKQSVLDFPVVSHAPLPGKE